MAYAEYAVAPAHTTFKVPKNMSFEEASTIPLVSLTAAISLFRRQGFAAPWEPEDADKTGKPLLVYAATSALGTFMIKLAKLARVGHITAIGGGSSTYLKTLLDAQDVFLDYRLGMDKVKQDVLRTVEDRKLTLMHAVDAFSEKGSWVGVSQMMHGGILSVFSGANRYADAGIPGNVQILYTYVGTGHEGAYKPGMPKQPSAEDAHGDVQFAGEFFNWIEAALQQGKFSGHPFEVVPEGLDGVAEGLNRLKNGQARGKKLVYRIRG
jgi:NADPH:quinone reductase-like Zn-dependent oxidoreductase